MTGSTAALCNQLIFEEIRFELELAHSAFHLGMAIPTFELLFISRNGKWRSESTKIVKDFEKNFPMFDIPHTAHRLSQSTGRILRSLGNHIAAEQYEVKAKYWILRRSGRNLRVANSARAERITDKNEFRLWEIHNLSTWSRDHMITCASLILQWIEIELKDGLMSDIEAKSLLRWEDLNITIVIPPHDRRSKDSMQTDAGIPFSISGSQSLADEPQKAELRDVVAKIHSALFADFIFGSCQPLPNDEWEAWFPGTETWLRLLDWQPSEIQRHRLLKEIQRGRAGSLLGYTHRINQRHQLSFHKSYLYEERERERERERDRDSPHSREYSCESK